MYKRQGTYLGGVAGYVDGSFQYASGTKYTYVSYCYNAGIVASGNANTYVGGISGRNSTGGTGLYGQDVYKRQDLGFDCARQ